MRLSTRKKCSAPKQRRSVSLTLRDKLALIYTSAGSLRRLSSFTGLSRYRVTKLLQPQFLGGYAENAPQRDDPDLKAAIDAAFSIHKDLCAQVTRAHRLPYLANVPVYMERAPRTYIDDRGRRRLRLDDNGRPILGERVFVPHTHWIDSSLRERWIEQARLTRFFYQISVRSEIDLAVYFDETEERFARERVKRTDAQWQNRAQFQRKIEAGQRVGYVYTTYRSMSPRFSAGHIEADIFNQLRAKHEAAALNLADQWLLQTDTRDEAIKRKAHKTTRRARKRR